MLALALTLTLLGDIAPPPPLKRAPPPPAAQCSHDSDCVLSTFNGCCGGCCGADPHAVRRDANESARCAVIDCAMPDCSAVRCAAPRPASEFVAACVQGACVATPKPPPGPAECRVDDECKVVEAPPAGAACHQSPCGCCPVSRAVPVEVVVPLQQRPGKPREPGAPPKFGLAPGDTGRATPSCSPCPQPEPARAACRGGRCVLQPLVRRPPPPG